MSSSKLTYPACPHCRGVTVIHSKNKCGNQRYRCTNADCKKTFVFPYNVLQQKNNPPCPKCEQNGSVQKRGVDKRGQKEKQRYYCTNCERSFLEGAKSKTLIEHEKRQILNALLGAMAKTYKIKDSETGEYHYEELKYRDRICNQFGISRYQLNKIYREYENSPPETPENKDTIRAVNERIDRRNNRLNHNTLNNENNIELSASNKEDENK